MYPMLRLMYYRYPEMSIGGNAFRRCVKIMNKVFIENDETWVNISPKR